MIWKILTYKIIVSSNINYSLNIIHLQNKIIFKTVDLLVGCFITNRGLLYRKRSEDESRNY